MNINYFEQLVGSNNLADLKYLVANKNYTYLHFSSGIQKASCYTLLQFEKYLRENTSFKRIHRSYMINVNFIDSVNINEGFLKLSSGIVVPISTIYIDNLELKIKQKKL